MENLRRLICSCVRAKQFLDRVKNTTRKAVFSESCFNVRVSFCPKLSMNLSMILISLVPWYLGIRGLSCQKAFLAVITRGCWPIGFPEFLSTMWYLLMADMAVKTTDHETLETYGWRINFTIRGNGVHWGFTLQPSQNFLNQHHLCGSKGRLDQHHPEPHDYHHRILDYFPADVKSIKWIQVGELLHTPLGKLEAIRRC